MSPILRKMLVRARSRCNEDPDKSRANIASVAYSLGFRDIGVRATETTDPTALHAIAGELLDLGDP